MDEEFKTTIKNLVDKFLGRENVEQIFKNEIFNEIDIKNIANRILGDEEDNKIINKDVIIDLELFEGLGNDKEDTILKYIDYTKTKLGRILLKRIISNPIKDITILKSRQNVIQKFIKDKNNLKIINSKLDIIKEKEEDLLWLWKDMNDETKQLFGMVYFQKNA